MCVEMILSYVAQGVTRCLAGLDNCVRGRDRAWGGSVATSHTGTVKDRRRRSLIPGQYYPGITLELMYETAQNPHK